MAEAVLIDNPVVSLIRDVLDGSPLFSHNGGPVTATFQEGHPDSRVLLMAGDNASGKSFFTRILAACLNAEKVEPLQVSMKYRAMSGMHRVFMYGPLGDEEDSTGNVSLHAIRGALGSAEDREDPCWVLLDEPDMGMSESYCAAMGTYLANYGNLMPLNKCQALSVVTHSRKLIGSMLFTLQKTPHFLCFGDYKPQEDLLQAWLEDERDRSVEELLSLNEKSRAMFQGVNKVLNDIKASQSAN
jgi:hypothetical protein